MTTVYGGVPNSTKNELKKLVERDLEDVSADDVIDEILTVRSSEEMKFNTNKAL